MGRYEQLIDAGWTPIAFTAIDDLYGDFPNDKIRAERLGEMFKARGLDITKRQRKTFEKDHRAWFFKQDDEGELITLEILRSATS